MPPNEDKKPVEQAAISLEQFESLRAELEGAKTALEAEKSRSVSLEERMHSFEQMAVNQFIDAIVAKAEAYRDEEKRAHSKVALEWLADTMKCKASEDGAIKLEADPSVADVHSYYRQRISSLFETMPGVVPMAEAETERADERVKASHDGSDEPDLDEDGLAELRNIWGIVPSEGGE